LCVLNRQPTCAKITQTVHGKGQRADMCTDGQPRTSCTTTDVLCVLMDTHGRHVCADGHTRTSCPTCAKITQTVHGKGQRADMCTDGQPRTSYILCLLTDTHRLPPTWAKITRTVHGKGQRAESKDQPTDVLCVRTDTHGHTRTATDVLCVLTDTQGGPLQPQTATDVMYSSRGPKSPKQSTGRVSVLSPRTNVLICVLKDSHGCPVCADGHTRTSCPQKSCVCWRTPTDVLCVLNRQPLWAKITQTVHRMGQRAESKDQRADMCTDGHRQTSCVPRGPKSPEQSTARASVLSPRTSVLICVLMNSHRRPVCADGHTRTHTNVLCVLTDIHGRPVCAAESHAQPRTSLLNRQFTWAKITQIVHGKGQRAESKDQRADMCTDGQPQMSCVC
ncbi:unnamed protein product, partial [Brassica rapa]